jgi:hypothetical protein
MADVVLQEFSWDRVIRAVEKVKDRLQRATAVLEAAGIPYAVVGGNAVAAWVSRVDEAAVRNTQDVDILIYRSDLDRTKVAFENGGFVYRHVKSIDRFLDGPNAKARDAVHIIFAEEKVRSEDLAAWPGLDSVERNDTYQIIALESLMRMKLTSYRDKDRTHLRDMLDVGLIDATWPGRFPPELGERLQILIDNPEG